MGIFFRKRVSLGRNAWINLSKRGATASVRIGRLTLNSGRRATVRLGKGLTWRSK